MDFDLVASTDEALRVIVERGPYDVLISDMERPEGRQAGYDLLAKIRTAGDHTSFIIYASSRAPEHFDEAVRRGALGCTNMPGELIDMVTKALRKARSTRSS